MRFPDVRLRAVATTAAVILIGGVSFAWLGDATPPADPRAVHAEKKRAEEVKARFDQGVVMLHAKQYDHALTAFHRVLELEPAIPEAHVNTGYALLGLKRYDAARDFFESATELRPGQANAYWGLAVALEALGDKPGAIGAMRTFVHLSKPDDPYVRRAQAALWEWETAVAEEREKIAKAPAKK
ncbi:MAG TPA: tetratricopeptide repeat protein [Burkholderiales bacterium]